MEQQPHRFNFGRSNAQVAPPTFNIRKKGVTRKSKKAMQYLSEIVGTSKLANDIVRIKSAQSRRGAESYIAKRGLDRVGYSVEEEDIDNDGIKDILIKDVDGNLVVVNGYTVKKSDYPYRQLYYEQDDDVIEQYKGKGGYKAYVRSVYGPTYDPRTFRITGYEVDPSTDQFTQRLIEKDFKVMKPKSPSAYQIFTMRFVKPLFAYLVGRYNLLTINEKPPNVLINFASHLWSQVVIPEVIERIYGKESMHEVLNNKKTLKRVLKSTEGKGILSTVFNEIANFVMEQNNDFIEFMRSILTGIIEDWYDRNPNSPERIDGFNEDGGEFSGEAVPVIPETEFV